MTVAEKKAMRALQQWWEMERRKVIMGATPSARRELAIRGELLACAEKLFAKDTA